MAYQFATYGKKDRIGDRHRQPAGADERAAHPPANLELHEIWNEFERDPDVWVGILTGAGDKAFSAGQRPPLHRRARARHDSGSRRPASAGWPIARAAGSRSLRPSTATRSAAASNGAGLRHHHRALDSRLEYGTSSYCDDDGGGEK